MSPCPEFIELLSAYADDALPIAERETVAKHLAGCDDCLAEMKAQQVLRQVLRGTPRQEQPPGLADRLVAIAGTDADQPLYARPFDPVVRTVRLPSRRRRVRQTLAATAAMIIAGAVTFAGIGWTAAPVTAATAVDPLPEARAEFSTAMSSLPLANGAVNAALVVDDHDAQREQAWTPTPATVTRAEGAYQWLQIAARAGESVATRGTQLIQSRHRAGYWESTLEVSTEPGQGTRVSGTGVPAAGALVPAEPSGGAGMIAANHALEAGDGPAVAGRSSVMVQALGQSGPVARWWIDRETGILLWQQSLDLTGQTVISAGYTSIEIGATAPARKTPPRLAGHVANSKMTVSSASLMNGLGWGATGRLAGLDLVRIRSDGGTKVHLFYSDGITTLSVIQQKGTLAAAPEGTMWDPGFQAYRSSGLPTALSWQSGNTVFTVLTDGPTDIARRAVAELPHQQPVARGAHDRVLDGWQEVTRDAMGN